MIKHPTPTGETVNHVESVIESNSHQAHEKQTQNKNESKMKASYSCAFHSVEPLFQRICIFFPPSPITLPFSRALTDCVRHLIRRYEFVAGSGHGNGYNCIAVQTGELVFNHAANIDDHR